MSGKLEIRLSAPDWEALDAVCKERRVSRSALVRSLIHAARRAMPAEAAPSLAGAHRATAPEEDRVTLGATTPSGSLPVVPLELHRALGLPEPTPTQIELYSAYPGRRGRLGEATKEEVQAAWVIAIADPANRTAIIFPEEEAGLGALRNLLRSLKVPKGLRGLLKERIGGVPFTTRIPEVPLTRWVSVGMPADGAYPEWFRRGFS